MLLPSPTAELAERYCAAGAWQARVVHELVAAAAAPDPAKDAVCDATRRLSYAELLQQGNALTAFLLEAGVGDGDCVAVQSGNTVELAVAHVACSRAGATFVPLSSSWRRTELRELLTVSRASVLLVPAADGHDYLAEVEPLRRALPELQLAGSFDGRGDLDLPAVLARDAPPVARPGDPNLPRYTMASSGTTNVPKLSLWTDNNLWAFCRAWCDAVELAPGDRMAGIAPAGTGAIGYVYGVLFPLLVGATSILLEHWEPAAALALVERERATAVTAVPTQLVKMIQEPSAATADLSDLRLVTNAGAPMPPDAAAAIEETWGCRIQTVYGATDGGVPLMTRVDDPPEKRRTTVGRVLPLTDFVLADPELEPVAAGTPGEILWRGPTKSYGYLNDDARTAEVFHDGFYRSGDLGLMDEDGYVRIVGRVKDMILRGGQNISPREIEEVVARHPSVAEAVAVGVPDPVYGERVCVAAVLRPGAALDLAGLGAFLAEQRLAPFKVPERLELFDELPRNASGKTSKDDVRRLVLER